MKEIFMINNIFAFGDSFLSGHGVNFSDNWLSVVERKLSIKVNNYAVSGGSNKLSIIKFFEQLEKITADQNNLVLFAWTSPVRTTFYNIDNATWENVQLGHYYTDQKVRQRVDEYYRQYYNDYESYVDFYQQQLLLTEFLKNKSIRYFYMNSFFDAAFGPAVANDKHYLEKFISKDNYLLDNRSIYEVVCLEQKMTCNDRFHPSEQGHTWLADYAIDFFKKNSII